MINKFYKKLSQIKDFSPWEKNNKIISEIDKYVKDNDFDIVVDDIVLEINRISSKLEYEFEKYYSNEIINSNTPLDELKNFIYYKDYCKFTNLEFVNLQIYSDNIKEILFIWGWPLPMTSIILALEFWIKSKIIDVNQEACNISQKLISSLWLSNKVTIQKADATTYYDNNKYDVCYIANLVFLNTNQETIFKNIKNINSNLFLTRSSYKTRQILYKKIDEEILNKYFNLELVIKAKNKSINSILIFTK